MNRETLAAIDIGSNAIRLLIKYVEENVNVDFKKAAFIRVPIRLGEDVFKSGYVSLEKKEKLGEAMLAFTHLMTTFNVRTFRACATSYPVHFIGNCYLVLPIIVYFMRSTYLIGPVLIDGFSLVSVLFIIYHRKVIVKTLKINYNVELFSDYNDKKMNDDNSNS